MSVSECEVVSERKRIEGEGEREGGGLIGSERRRTIFSYALFFFFFFGSLSSVLCSTLFPHPPLSLSFTTF